MRAVPGQQAHLPRIDEHATDVAADPDDVWAALGETLDAVLSRRWTAAASRVVGCADSRASGPRPLVEGSTIPGFRVTAAVPRAELALEGRHFFSTYVLTFRIDPLEGDRTRLRAESRAAFPGVAGRTYRLLVIGTGGHVVAVRRLLADVRRRAERRTART
ncbi:hypothetical protein [Blastococcus sp. CT_GayMR16]|uniref:hypothetical protein n=1 Tax=Blastococcus sp. CT_GayMR16 TaxID=2559607 RepID=UPI001073E822|nr:hypothetical protein [Blastococcus sp. CT_GayMR16]TFV86982.1 hypothetical protein E4P38_15180 [Blastococcus sp. CT_GayMR16]